MQRCKKNLEKMKTMNDLDQYLSLVGRGNSKFSIAYSKICSSLIDDNHDDLEQVPWPDVVQALIDYKLGQRPTYDPFSSHGANMVVVYFARHLNNFKAKHKTTSTLSFSRQGEEEEVPIKSQLLDEIQDELAKSLDFEKTLESLKNNPIRKEVVNEDTIEYDTIIDQHENVM